ncbi:hypothetical protein PSACC_03378 [Paramicrosporidium saccamoebae]|uniref:Uncharacterized protein n=1 Tax=Paramicrosporidium saccamoebae TaxID=1246581 RepID=A0A2H9TG94_9FUNG|nr:hypothetical protein PSACC_03378 [Paramicrosporidium saccamoebae]
MRTAMMLLRILFLLCCACSTTPSDRDANFLSESVKEELTNGTEQRNAETPKPITALHTTADIISSKDPFTPPALISIEVAARKGHGNILEWYWKNYAPTPTIHQLVFSNLLTIADWLRSKSGEQYPTQAAINEAVQQGHTPALEWMLNKNSKIAPDLESVVKTVSNGYEGSLIILLQHRPGCLLNSQVIDALAIREYWSFINYLLNVNIEWTPSQSNADHILNSAALNGHVGVLKYCHFKNPTLLLDLKSIMYAKAIGHSDVEDWFISALANLQTAGTLPDVRIDHVSDETIKIDPTHVKAMIELLAQQDSLEISVAKVAKQPELLSTSSNEAPNFQQETPNGWRKRLSELTENQIAPPPLSVYPRIPAVPVSGVRLLGDDPVAANTGSLQPRLGQVASLRNSKSSLRAPPPTQTRVYPPNHLLELSESSTKVSSRASSPARINPTNQLQGCQFHIPKRTYVHSMASSSDAQASDVRVGTESTEQQPSPIPTKRRRLDDNTRKPPLAALFHDSS